MTDLVFIRAYASRFEAELAQQFLVDQGIDAMVQADDAGGMYAGLSLGRKGVRLLVRAADADSAREALERLAAPDLDEEHADWVEDEGGDDPSLAP